MIPLSVATDGYIRRSQQYSSLEVAVEGYLSYDYVLVIIRTPTGGGAWAEEFYKNMLLELDKEDFSKDEKELLEFVIVVVSEGLI